MKTILSPILGIACLLNMLLYTILVYGVARYCDPTLLVIVVGIPYLVVTLGLIVGGHVYLAKAYKPISAGVAALIVGYGQLPLVFISPLFIFIAHFTVATGACQG